MTVYFDMPVSFRDAMWSQHWEWDVEWPSWNSKLSHCIPDPASPWDGRDDGSGSCSLSQMEEPGEVLLVNSTSSGAFAKLRDDAASADVVSFDAEWVPDWSYGSDNPISVLQLAFPASRRVYVLQLALLGNKLPQEVQMMLVNPEVTKVGFAVCHKDLKKLSRTGIAVTQASVVDVQTQCAAALGVSWECATSLSLRQAANELLGCNLVKDKRCSCSDWSAEQLSEEQICYAALDAWVPLRLYYLSF